jgi:DedD protein
MEEPLKARLIGAAVLVAIAVLLIPELLSGRKAGEPVVEEGTGQRGTRTFNIELSGGSSQSVRSAPAVTSPASGAPAPPQKMASARPSAEAEPGPEARPPPARPAAPEPEAAAASAESKSVPPPSRAAPAAAAPPAVKPPPTPAASGGGWAVQVGAFGSAGSARGLVQELTGAGYRAYVSPVTRSGKTLHRVRVGPEGDKAGAEQLARRLKARGLPATVVQND